MNSGLTGSTLCVAVVRGNGYRSVQPRFFMISDDLIKKLGQVERIDPKWMRVERTRGNPPRES